MKHLCIIGARGYGREVYFLAQRTNEYLNGIFDIKGFLDDKSDALEGLIGDYPPILSSVESYEVQEDDVFVCAMGDNTYRKKYADMILNKGGRFINLVCPTAVINPTASIGIGCIISNGTIISDNVTIGDFAVIQSYDVIGHDVKIADYATIESFCFFGGYSKMGKMSTMHTRSSIIPHKSIGSNVVVGTGSVVMTKVKDGWCVFGNPAKKMSID